MGIETSPEFLEFKNVMNKMGEVDMYIQWLEPILWEAFKKMVNDAPYQYTDGNEALNDFESMIKGLIDRFADADPSTYLNYSKFDN